MYGKNLEEQYCLVYLITGEKIKGQIAQKPNSEEPYWIIRGQFVYPYAGHIGDIVIPNNNVSSIWLTGREN